MKYCLDYDKKNKYIDKVDEIIFPYHHMETFKFLLTNFDKFEHQRIILKVPIRMFNNPTAIDDAIKMIKSINLDIVLMIEDTYNKDLNEFIDKFKSNNIKFFFRQRVKDWDTFLGLIELGVSDVYIVEEMGFVLELLGPRAHASSVLIRVFANICQTSWSKTNSLKTFFIRPEDMELYSQYVDVVEFFGEETAQLEVMYKVYAIDKKWFGDLREIIIGLDVPLYSPSIFTFFGEVRTRCNRKCLKGGTCQLCDRIAEASETFFKNGILVK